VELSAESPLWQAARAILAGRIDDLFRRWDRAVRTGGLDDIHDLRVSSRRMREGLLLFAPVYPPAAVRKAAKRVKRVTVLLGEQRNLDEARLFFADLHREIGPSCHGCLAVLIGDLDRQREGALAEMTSGLSRIDRYDLHRLLIRTARFPALLTASPDPADPFGPVSAFARQSMEERCAGLLALVETASRESEAEAQHRLRIAVKHLRYRLEMLSFLLGSAYDGLHASLKTYQDLLGTMHDLDVFAGMAGERGLPEQDLRTVTAAIAERRRRAFASFRDMLDSMPPAAICGTIRSTL
jgi:CHAD domain-containing protein